MSASVVVTDDSFNCDCVNIKKIHEMINIALLLHFIFHICFFPGSLPHLACHCLPPAAVNLVLCHGSASAPTVSSPLAQRHQVKVNAQRSSKR